MQRLLDLQRLPFVLAAAAVVALVFGAVLLEPTSAGDGPTPAAADRARVPGDVLPARMSRLAQVGFDPASSRRVAPHLYLVRRNASELCQVVVHDTGGGGGACGPADEFFGGRLLAVGTGAEGPSAGEWIAGVGRKNVAAVRIHLGAQTHDVSLTKDGGFYYESTPEEAAAEPAASIDALGPSGKVLASYPLPQG
jgi:hypothetical protein